MKSLVRVHLVKHAHERGRRLICAWPYSRQVGTESGLLSPFPTSPTGFGSFYVSLFLFHPLHPPPFFARELKSDFTKAPWIVPLQAYPRNAGRLGGPNFKRRNRCDLKKWRCRGQTLETSLWLDCLLPCQLQKVRRWYLRRNLADGLMLRHFGAAVCYGVTNETDIHDDVKDLMSPF